MGQVPGHPTATLDYSARAERLFGRTVKFWLDLTNPTGSDIHIVVCAMLSLDKPTISVPNFSVSKVAGEWRCAPDGMRTTHPNLHFACKQTTISAGSTRGVFDTSGTFSVDFEDSELGMIYFDILRDCPVVGCAAVVGPDHFVIPSSPTPGGGEDPDWVNWWAGHFPYADLLAETSPGISSAFWPSGNWFTMGFPDLYPARLIGTLTAAAPGSTLRVMFGDQTETEFKVVADPDAPERETRLEIEQVFSITENPAAIDRIVLTVPSDDRGIVEEGRVVRFNAQVFAEPGAPGYDVGQFMHGIDAVFVKDTQPPIIESFEVRPSPNTLLVDVTASDVTTHAIGAAFAYSVDGAPEVEVAIAFGDPAIEDQKTFFSDQISGLPNSVPITYRVHVIDDVGNRASSDTETVVLPTDTVVLPTCGEGLVCGAGNLGVLPLLLAGLTALRLIRHRRNGDNGLRQP
ncbi:MAG: hypothetical protein O7D91_03215 [Planctomycetota bacterium]|nr:hypothetical protein [Planctomycetota bacterium]